jgi:hypothetical protein
MKSFKIPVCLIFTRGRNNLQSRVRTHAVLMIGLYELLGNPITFVPNSLSHQGPYTSNEDNIIAVAFPFVIGFFLRSLNRG